MPPLPPPLFPAKKFSNLVRPFCSKKPLMTFSLTSPFAPPSLPPSVAKLMTFFDMVCATLLILVMFKNPFKPLFI